LCHSKASYWEQLPPVFPCEMLIPEDL